MEYDLGINAESTGKYYFRFSMKTRACSNWGGVGEPTDFTKF